MDFSDTSNKQGLVQDCDFLVTSDSTSYPLANKAASANRYHDEATSIILKADGNWQWDDLTNTNEPVGLADLVADQQGYALTGAIWSIGGGADAALTNTLLTLNSVEVKDTDGTWRALIPIDIKNFQPPTGNPVTTGSTEMGNEYSLTDFLKTAGTPIYYDKNGNYLNLYPKPNYSQTDSLKIRIQRRQNLFASTDTTKRAGFAPHLHRFLSLGMAYDYAVAKMLATNKITSLANELNRYRVMISEHYSTRQKEVKRKMVANYQNNK